MNGLYYYKLESPYEYDVTKNCKLTIDEIDSNFFNLKKNDIKDILFDEETKLIKIIKNSGDTYTLDLKPLTNNLLNKLEINYDKLNGELSFNINDDLTKIDGLITKDNLPNDYLKNINTDYSLNGDGTILNPLKISQSEKTGMLKAVLSQIDYSKNEKLPENPKLGDRYLTKEIVSDFGYLYNFNGVSEINKDIEKTGWRVPTKNDWDNMLNAIEACEYRNHDSIESNEILGKVAGKLLKSQKYWTSSNHDKNVNTANMYDLSLMPCGKASENKSFYDFKLKGAYWSNTVQNDTDVYTKVFMYDNNGVLQYSESPNNYVSLRLIKDYNGSNHQQYELINGVNYGTVLIPSLNCENGYTIWTSNDVSFNDEKYNPLTPNNGDDIIYYNRYCVNEWDGKQWVTRELTNGDSLMIINNGNEINKLYTLIDNQLFSLSDYLSFGIYDVLEKKLIEETNSLNDKYNTINTIVNQLFNEFYTTINLLQENDSTLQNNINELGKSLNELNTKLDSKPTLLSGEYNKTNETIDLTLSNNEKVIIEVGDLINELSVSDNQDTPIVLRIEKIKSKEDEHGDLIWKDVLKADIRISDDQFNILKKDQTGTLLTVEGVASNIMYEKNKDEYISLQKALDTLEIKPSTEEDNIIVTKVDDGLYANVDLGYNDSTNVLTLYKTNGVFKDIQLNSVNKIQEIKYDEETNNILISYILNGNEEYVSINIDDFIKKLKVDDTNTIGLKIDGNTNTISGNVKISTIENNAMQIKENGLYVSNKAEDILINDTNVKNSIDIILKTFEEPIDGGIYNGDKQ